jgi:hypothetical protein
MTDFDSKQNSRIKEKAVKKEIFAVSVSVAVIIALYVNAATNPTYKNTKYNETLNLSKEDNYASSVEISYNTGDFNKTNTLSNYISANGCHTVGIKTDGTVIAVGKNDDGQCNVSDWKLKTY